MEAPEKIYIHPDIGGREFLRPWLHRPANNESVEYVRKDAVIEKACEWLKNHNDYITIKDGIVTYFDMEKCIEDLVKHMEGGEE